MRVIAEIERQRQRRLLSVLQRATASDQRGKCRYSRGTNKIGISNDNVEINKRESENQSERIRESIRENQRMSMRIDLGLEFL